MKNSQTKNKLKTPGYFIKRLKDNDFVTLRIFDKYSEVDPRRWTILVDPSGSSVYITCFENTPFKGEYLFNFNDGNRNFKGNVSLKTFSIEVVIQKLIKSGVRQREENDFLNK